MSNEKWLNFSTEGVGGLILEEWGLNIEGVGGLILKEWGLNTEGGGSA